MQLLQARHRSMGLFYRSFSHSLDNCNSLLLNLPATQTNCLQLVLNSVARAVTKTNFHHITHVLINLSLQWPTFLHPLSSFIIFTLFYTRSSFITLSRHPSPWLVLKLQTNRFIILPFVFWSSLPYVLRHVAHYVTPSSILTHPSLIFQPVLFLKVKTPSFSLFSSSLNHLHLTLFFVCISSRYRVIFYFVCHLILFTLNK